MKTFLLPAIITAATAAAAVPAAAQSQFDGPYVGIQAGLNHNDIDRATTEVGTLTLDRSRDSATAGGFAGYNYKASDRIVLSVEGGFNLGIDDAVRSARAGTAAVIDPEYAFDLGARAGYLVGDTTLLYVRGGYENLRAKVRLTDAAGTRSGHETFDGWTAGTGVERALTDRISARVEYRYSDLGGSDTKFERHQGLLGIAYRF